MLLFIRIYEFRRHLVPGGKPSLSLLHTPMPFFCISLFVWFYCGRSHWRHNVSCVICEWVVFAVSSPFNWLSSHTHIRWKKRETKVEWKDERNWTSSILDQTWMCFQMSCVPCASARVCMLFLHQQQSIHSPKCRAIGTHIDWNVSTLPHRITQNRQILHKTIFLYAHIERESRCTENETS